MVCGGRAAVPAVGSSLCFCFNLSTLAESWFRSDKSLYKCTVKMEATATTGPAFASFALPKLSRRKFQIIKVHNANLSDSKQKKAYLFATRKQRIGLPNYDVGSGGKTFHIREFLSDPSGVEAILNAKALQSFQSLGSNLYRCTLPRIQLLNFEVAPVVDLRVTSTSEVCTVEMLSCTFEGSEIMERQNKHFSASMRNQITWDTNNSEPFLDVDVELNLALEIYTQPFTLLPISAVEGPGNLVMQALLDRLVPLLLQQLLRDYDNWVQQKSEFSS